jgi:hypothetical protein
VESATTTLTGGEHREFVINRGERTIHDTGEHYEQGRHDRHARLDRVISDALKEAGDEQ